jgi:hypothetical protein
LDKDKDAPVFRPVQRTGIINSRAILGWLYPHHLGQVGDRQNIGVGDARRAVAKAREGRVSAGLISCGQDGPSAQFQLRIGTMPEGNKLGLVAREIDDRDVPNANLVFGRLRDRNLPAGRHGRVPRTCDGPVANDHRHQRWKCRPKTVINGYISSGEPASLPTAPGSLY